MGNKAFVILKNLSAITFILIYLVMVIIHLVSDSFIPADQMYLMLLMLPFIFIGLALDYILRYNKTMKTRNRVLIKLLPIGVFIMMLLNTMNLFSGEDTLDIFGYLFWIFISLPFFLSSYQKEGLRTRILRTLIGAGGVTVAYMFLTTQTGMLDKNYGFIIIIISYFFMLYVASGIKRLPYIGIVLGILNAAAMLFLRYFPITKEAIAYGWDIDITGKIDLLIIFTFIFCILIRIYEVSITKNKKAELSEIS